MSRAAELVRSARVDARMTQRELAAVSGIPQASVARIERSVAIPRVDTLERLLRACGMTLTVRPADDGIDRSVIRERMALTPLERHQLAVVEANAALHLLRGQIVPRSGERDG